MQIKSIIKQFVNWLPPILVMLTFIFIWELSCQYFDIKEYLVPSPSRIFEEMLLNFKSLMGHCFITAIESILGFVIANILSLLIAVGFVHSKWFEKSFYPYTIALKSIPVVAIAPLLVLWFGYGLSGKIVMAAIISFFPLVVNATIGLKSIDTEALDLMKSISASKLQILFKLRFPHAVPFIFSALKISSTLAVVGSIVGEMTGAKEGIGFIILMSSYNIDTPLLFAAIILASLMGILFFGLIVFIESIINNKFNYSDISEGKK